MNSKLKKQVLESLKLGKEAIWSGSRFIHECDDPSIVKLKSTIAAVESEPDSQATVRVWNERDVEIVEATIKRCIAGIVYDAHTTHSNMLAINEQAILDSLKGK